MRTEARTPERSVRLAKVTRLKGRIQFHTLLPFSHRPSAFQMCPLHIGPSSRHAFWSRHSDVKNWIEIMITLRDTSQESFQ